jgi:hypothetical protein
MQNKFDIYVWQTKITVGIVTKLFWGVETFDYSGMYQPLNDAILDLWLGRE